MAWGGAGGISDDSRWSSEAIPPVFGIRIGTHPGGMPSQGRRTARAGIPPGCISGAPRSGGVAALNHPLQDWIPPGSRPRHPAPRMTAFPKHDHYKDSGVEWLREVPEHWESEKGKWLFTKMERPVRPGDGVVTAFRDGQVTLRANRRTQGFTNALKEHGYQGIRQGDLVINAMDAPGGAIGISDSDGKSTPVYSACVSRIENNVTPPFYAYLLRHMALSGFIETLAKGIRER